MPSPKFYRYITKNCERCAVEYQCRYDMPTRFCGNTCANRIKALDKIGKPLSEEHKNKIRQAHAGMELWRHLMTPEARAKGKANAVHASGEDHWNWKGGVCDESHLVRNTGKWREWRLAVFARDDYTCQRCQVRGGHLHPHHIIPRRVAPDLIWDVDNGQTLCGSCHIITEWEYRKVEQSGAELR